MALSICFLTSLSLFLLPQTPPQDPPVPVRAPNLVPSSPPLDVPLIPDSPFSATATTEITEANANGTSPATKAITVIARDSKGRTYIKSHFPVEPSDTGNGRIRKITISDPIAHTRTELDPATMQATTFNLPPPSGPAPTPSPAANNLEDLGASVIEGVSVHGYRRSMSLRLNPPAFEKGPIGEGSQLSVKNEYWFSDQLQMAVTSKTQQTGGRNQTTTQTLSQIILNEPDPQLFQTPPDYKVADVRHPAQISRAVAESNLLNHVDPIYPPLAKAARVQGYVEFTAAIGPDGVIKNLQLVRGHPLLVNAAKEAVLQWRYRPTLLNGQPVSVTAPVVVTFTLSDQN